MTRPSDSQQKKRTYQIVDIADPVAHRKAKREISTSTLLEN